MLVISRCLNAGIRIGEDTEVKVLRLGTRRVTLGVECPPGIPVFRSEVAPEMSSPESQAPPLDIRVLIVEDIPVHGLLIERSLCKKGVSQIEKVTSAEDAIRLLESIQQKELTRPDLVLLDLGLPGVSGLEVLKKIRSAFGWEIAVVVLTCSNLAEDYRQAMAAGANAFVSKGESYEAFRQQLLSIINFWGKVAYRFR